LAQSKSSDFYPDLTGIITERIILFFVEMNKYANFPLRVGLKYNRKMQKNTPDLQTPDLLLRAWKPEDTQALFTILQEPGILKYYPPTTFDLPKTNKYIDHQLNHWSKYGFGHWAVVLPENGQLIGWNGLEFLSELEEVEIAYLLKKQFQGRGFATQIANAALQFGFEVIGLPSIIGLVHPDNTPSIHVLHKCGFVFSEKIALWGIYLDRYCITKETYHLKHGPIFTDVK